MRVIAWPRILSIRVSILMLRRSSRTPVENTFTDLRSAMAMRLFFFYTIIASFTFTSCHFRSSFANEAASEKKSSLSSSSLSSSSSFFKFMFNPRDNDERNTWRVLLSVHALQTGETREDFREEHVSPVFERVRRDSLLNKWN